MVCTTVWCLSLHNHRSGTDSCATCTSSSRLHMDPAKKAIPGIGVFGFTSFFWGSARLLIIRVGNSLIRSNLLKSLRTNEWLWVIFSDCSGQMSNVDQIAQVAHDKRAIVSNLLRSLMIKEQMSESLLFCESIICEQKTNFLTKIIFFCTFL